MDFQALWASVADFFSSVWNNLESPLFKVKETTVSTATILLVVMGYIVLTIFTKVIQKIVKGVLNKTGMQPSISRSIANLTRIFLMSVGVLIIIHTAGINLSALAVVFGALAVGIGFGLQKVTENFISGIIILFEKPIKVGDRIQIDDLSGNVKTISLRTTTIITNDNYAIIIPNSEFVSGRVINWSHNDSLTRFAVPVGVSYNEDPKKIKQLLLEVAAQNEHVLKEPAPDVFFTEFGDSSLNFSLMVWTGTYTDRPKPFKSMLYFSIFEKFKEHGVEIPFPQRDIHLRSSAIPCESKEKAAPHDATSLTT